jgi:hypothetical protein
MTATELSLLGAILVVGLLTACLAILLHRRLKEQQNTANQRITELSAKLQQALQKEAEKLQRVMQKETKTIRSEILNTANAALSASWYDQTRPKRINAALPLVLITQIQRSGGTLLSQLFDGHPEVFAFPHELKWGEDLESKYLWPEVNPQDGPLQIARSLVAYNLKDLKNFNLFGYTKPGAVPGSSDLRIPFRWSEWAYIEAFLDGWDAIRPQNRRQCFDLFMSSFFSAFVSTRTNGMSKKIITAFVPRVNFIQSYPKNIDFFEDYPDGLMICICRHPADWYASASRHEAKYIDVDQAMELWRESAESAMQLKEDYADQVVLVDFASLVGNPSSVMRFLAERLDLSWHPTLISPTFNARPIGSNSSFGSVVGIDASAVERRSSLAPELREQIEASNLLLYKRFIERADLYSSKIAV